MSDSLDFDGLQLGDLVNFVTKDYSDTLTEIILKTATSTHTIKQGRKNSLPPTMVVVELVRLSEYDNKLYDETSGHQIKEKVQVKCMWYAKIQGKERFHERWFNRSVLEKVEIESEWDSNFSLNKVVTLRTSLAAEKEANAIIKAHLEYAKTSLQYKFETDTSSFFPPKLVVTAIGKLKEKNITYNERTGKIAKWGTSREHKCMWYDADSGKFSERFFPEEALIVYEGDKFNPLNNSESTIWEYRDYNSQSDSQSNVS
ncbi:MAG: hypothetical protein R3C61_27585 [Bacteroidia bacterium]